MIDPREFTDEMEKYWSEKLRNDEDDDVLAEMFAYDDGASNEAT